MTVTEEGVEALVVLLGLGGLVWVEVVEGLAFVDFGADAFFEGVLDAPEDEEVDD